MIHSGSLSLVQRSTCNAHKAVNLANAERHRLAVTGIGACACTCHGCFVPHSVVDFQKGERYVDSRLYPTETVNAYNCVRQMNMDYCLAQALHQYRGTKYFYLIYDIICQFWPNLAARMSGYTILKWLRDITVFWGIGKFHVGGHIRQCFARFNPWFIPFIGVIDGEILETRWAILNEISGSTRTMTTSHRRETLNDHMGDCNWRKTVNMGRSSEILSPHTLTPLCHRIDSTTKVQEGMQFPNEDHSPVR